MLPKRNITFLEPFSTIVSLLLARVSSVISMEGGGWLSDFPEPH